MLGSLADADDAVQEPWLRLSRSRASEVENLRGWLTSVAARICLDAADPGGTQGRTARPGPPHGDRRPKSPHRP